MITGFEGDTEIGNMLLSCRINCPVGNRYLGSIANARWPRCCEQDVRRVCAMECFRITNSVEWQILLFRKASYYRFIELTTQSDNLNSFRGLCGAAFSKEVKVWAELCESAESLAADLNSSLPLHLSQPFQLFVWEEELCQR